MQLRRRHFPNTVITKNPATQKFYIHFFIDNSNAISLYTLSCPKLKSMSFHLYSLWQYGLWSFQMGGTKLERFLPKNQHPQRKLLNFKNWISGGLRSFQKSDF